MADAQQRSSAILKQDPEKTLTLGKRTWVQFRGQLTKDMVGGGLISIETGTKGGGFEAASPEIVALPTRPPRARRARGAPPRSPGRPCGPDERATFAAYAAIPRQYVPAGRIEPNARAPRPPLAAKKAPKAR